MFSPVVTAKKKVNGAEGGKDLHMFVWSSSASPVSEGGVHHHVFRGEYGNEHGVGNMGDHHGKGFVSALFSVLIQARQ